MPTNITKNNSGVAAILTVVIIAAVALLLARNAALIGRIDIDMVNNNILFGIARANAESCLEESLRQIQIDNNFISNDLSLDLSAGTCLASVSQSGGVYTIYSEGRMQTHLKIIESKASLVDNSLIISYWQSK